MSSTTTQLLEIRPRELKFTIELKKHSSCSVKICNKSDQYVAFKVKTTSPRKYCVRPNVGVIKGLESCDITVIMQAQTVVPLDLQCKDKFLVQSTIVPRGTAEEDITSEMFSKTSRDLIEEKKLKVVLITPPHSPVLLLNNGEPEKDLSHHVHALLNNGTENISTQHILPEAILGSEGNESRKPKVNGSNEVERERRTQSSEDIKEQNSVKYFEELKSKLNEMDAKLREADCTITELTRERNMATKEKHHLKHEVEMILKRKNYRRRAQAGFPLLYVCMVALVSMVLGYRIHS